MRKINIQPALNGFIVRVGCQDLVFESVDALINNLRSYLSDPALTERTFLDTAINRQHTMPVDLAADCEARAADQAQGQAVGLAGAGVGRAETMNPAAERIRAALVDRPA